MCGKEGVSSCIKCSSGLGLIGTGSVLNVVNGMNWNFNTCFRGLCS